MILFHYETLFFLEEKKKIEDWVREVIALEKRKEGEINYVFCDDNYLLEKNIKHLNRDTLTDIITFNYCEKDIISSDIMISIERVKENSITFENSFTEELYRVMIHGILHLIGYDDLSKEDKDIMTEKENYYLKKIL